MAAITIAGENLIAEKQAAQEVLVVSRFLYALVPGLDPATPVDRYAGKPPPEQMMYETDITKGGYVDPNQVVYSSMIGSNVGDWDFNWLGLETAEGVLLAAAYTPVQQKRKNIPNQQIGNNITRNMMLVFDGAQSVTELTINADTWQADFTVRMAGMDERERLSNRDMFGRACFFADSLALVYQNEQFTIQPGTAYVEGLAVHQPAGGFITPPAFPFTLWYDISLKGELSDVKVVLATSYGDALVDFVDNNGVWHYLVPVATVLSTTEITDLRSTVEPVAGALIQHLAARNGDYPDLRARGTTKDDVDLGNLPNAKSDDPESNSSDILATTAALHAIKESIEADLDALGSAAYLDAQIGLDDATVDALMKVGAFGIGGSGIVLPVDTNLDTVILGGHYRLLTGGNIPPGGEYSVMLVVRGSDVVAQVIINYQSGTIISRGAHGIGNVPVFSEWNTSWNTSNFNPAAYQPALGFTPAQQGGGAGQDANKIYIGYNNASGQIKIQVDAQDFGHIWTESNFDPASIFAVPVGVPFPWPTATPPENCVVMTGQPFNVEWYPALVAVYPSGILPDLRGESIRGLDGGRGVDPDWGRPVLSAQLDTLQNMTGEFVLQDDDSTLLVNNATGVFSVGNHSSAITPAAPQVTTTGYRSVVFNPSAVVRVSTETRMRNVAYNYICRMY